MAAGHQAVDRRTWNEIAAKLGVAESTAIWLAGRYRTCGHERILTPRETTGCPECGATITARSLCSATGNRGTNERRSSRHPPAPTTAEVEQEILARIDPAGLHICEAELRWDEQKNGPLLDVLSELERQGLIESALHFRLTDHCRIRLPGDYRPPLRCGTGIPWRVPS